MTNRFHTPHIAEKLRSDRNKPGWGGASTGEACGELLQAPGK